MERISDWLVSATVVHASQAVNGYEPSETLIEEVRCDTLLISVVLLGVVRMLHYAWQVRAQDDCMLLSEM